jgi:outer membrane protein assembly factor BamB
MIRNINYFSNNIIFYNGDERVVLTPLRGFGAFGNFLQVNNGLICVLKPSRNATEEQSRRNVVKFDEEGKVSWQIEDKYETFWKKQIKQQDSPELEYERKYGLHDVYLEKDGRITVSDTQGTKYTLNSDTGEIRWEKPQGRPW